MSTYVLKVSRSGTDRWSEYRIQAEPEATIIELLEEIQRFQDPSLIYRHSCHHGSCGTCACIINGKEALACRTTAGSLGTEVITVEPLKGFPLIGDLAVDMESMIKDMPDGSSYIREDEFSATEGVKHQRFEDCIECGCCMSACPVGGDFIGPAPLAMMNRELQKGSENQDNIRAKALERNGAPACKEHFACSRVCPSSVFPGRHIQELKKLGP